VPGGGQGVETFANKTQIKKELKVNFIITVKKELKITKVYYL